MTTPVFAVVGHPNKGKSSLVATLARDDSVHIAPDPGTTRRARAYPMRVGGRVLYTLVDTPGFQRARRVLAWLRETAEREQASAADRPELVARFVRSPELAARHPDEHELLAPIVEGASILYVVDGSVPYGREYEPEMEVLRWTGQPSMAVVNPIRGAAHVDAWQKALGQYFRIVRVLDAVRSEFDERLDLLRAFGELREDWRDQLLEAVDALGRERAQRRTRSAQIIASAIAEVLAHAEEQRLEPGELPETHHAELSQRYEAALRGMERRARRDVEAVYDHRELIAHESELELLEADLFDEDSWLVFGLRRSDVLAAGAAGGALGGGALDLAVGGASLFAGAALGAAAGAAAGWWSSRKLAQLRVVDQPLGGRLVRCGPSRNPNLPFVLLGRARHHHAVVAGRTHAERGEVDLEAGRDARAPLEPGTRTQLARQFARLARTPGDAGARAELARSVESLLAADEGRPAP